MGERLARLKLVATLHNRRGDPLILLRFLRKLVDQDKVTSIGVCWSTPTGESEPTWAELQAEEKRVQETLRSAVRLVHDSNLSLEAKVFLGRCYRSFQYEFMVALNLKRHDTGLKLVLLDDPRVRDARYKEIGSPREFLREVAAYPVGEQERALRTRYAEYRKAYERMDLYEKMVFHPTSALLEISHEIIPLNQQREQYVARIIKNAMPEVVVVRLIHCLESQGTSVPKLSLRDGLNLPSLLGLGHNSVMKLSEAESIVEALPQRD